MARNKVHTGGAQKVHTGTPEGLGPTVENPNPQLGSAKQTIVERAIDPTGEGKLTPAPFKGGSYGVIPEAEQRVTFHAGTTMRKDAVPARKPKTYIITGGPTNGQGKFTFMYDHQRVSVAYGKEVTEQTYDLALLRAQGIRLEEVIDPLGEAQAQQLAQIEEPVVETKEDESNEDGEADKE